MFSIANKGCTGNWGNQTCFAYVSGQLKFYWNVLPYYLRTTIHIHLHIYTFHSSTKAIIACHSVHSKPSFTCAPAQFQVHIIVLLCMYKIISLSKSQRNDAPHELKHKCLLELQLLSCTLMLNNSEAFINIRWHSLTMIDYLVLFMYAAGQPLDIWGSAD